MATDLSLGHVLREEKNKIMSELNRIVKKSGIVKKSWSHIEEGVKTATEHRNFVYLRIPADKNNYGMKIDIIINADTGKKGTLRLMVNVPEARILIEHTETFDRSFLNDSERFWMTFRKNEMFLLDVLRKGLRKQLADRRRGHARAYSKAA